MRPTIDPSAGSVIETLEPRVLLSTLTVTTSNDSGAGSLRQAITDANDAPGADIIEFDPSLEGSTIALTSGQLVIRDALEIRGTDSEGTPLGITISAGYDSRHFAIFDAENDIEVTISDLTITEGRLVDEPGGSILNLDEDLTLERVTMSSNSGDGPLTHGGAIHSTGPLTIRDSEFVSNSSTGVGGAISFVGRTLIIADSTFTNNNSAARGGAINLYGGSDATISGTTFESNLATGDSGAIHLARSTLTVSDSTLAENRVGRHGGAISALSGSTVTIADSTIENNTAPNDGGAIYTDDGTITIEGSTLSGNNALSGGGVYNFAGSLSLTDSTVAGNVASASGGGLYADFDADLILLRVTVSGNASGGAAGGIYTSGGLTMTESTVTNNAADSSGGGIRAIGPQPVSFVSSTISDNTSEDEGGGLALYGTMDIEIAGSTFSRNSVRDDGGGGGVSIRNNDGAEFSITGSTFNGNFADTSGGGLDVTSNVVLTITDSFFTDNFVGDPGPGIGGGIQFTQGTLTITNSTISGNESWGDGGGIYATGNLNISDSDISDNIATNHAGGIMFRGETLSIADSTIRGNTAEETGGGLAARGSVEHQIIRTTIEANTASYGAGIGLTSDGVGNAPFRLDYSTVSGNTATARGGGIYYDFGALLISHSTISGNTAGDTGGGISQHRTTGQSTFANSTIAFNTVTNEDGLGGGIFIGGNGFTLTSTIVANNTREFGDSTPDDITAEFENYTVDADSSFNLIGDANAGGGLSHGENGNLVGVDPLLEPLADNGGPTLTHAIPQHSPAVDAGAAFSALETDQRGAPYERFVGDGPDIGAFEWAPFSLRALDGAAPATTSLANGTHLSVARNAEGDLIVFEGAGSEWTALRFEDHTDAPTPTGDPIIWTDPNDGLAYIAAPSDGGFLLFRRASNGAWSYRDLAAETASSDDAPVGTLAYFITRPRTGAPLVFVAGINGAGEIVAYQQTSAAGAAQASWSLYNISDDLASQSMTTPAFTQMTSYVTSWNQWTLAGLDGDGNVQGIWVNIATFDTWRVDNLSAITGADPLTGELDVTLTTWGGIRFAGANGDGRLVATWWNPALGGGNWRQTDLTGAVQAGAAPALEGGRLTAWFTPSDQISYAGYNADGDVVSFYWQPSDGGNWNSDNLTDGVADDADRPTGALTSHVSADGEVSLSGASAGGDVLRLWAPDGSRGFMLDILSDLAVRI